MRKAFVTVALAGIVALSGCGTLFQGLQVKGPAVFGGLRLDVEQFDHPQSHLGEKIFYCLDMPFSLAGDACFLLFSVINELYEGGIDVEPQNPKTLGSPRHVGAARPPLDADRIELANDVIDAR